MHVLSVVTALLFAFTSFAAIAPTHNSSTTDSHNKTTSHNAAISHNTTNTVPAGTHKVNPFIHQSVDASQIDSAVSAQGDESAQNLKNIMFDATGKLDLMSKQLSQDLQGTDTGSVVKTISQINVILSEISGKIEIASKKVEMTPSNVSFLGPFVFDLLSLLATILFNLILAINGILWNTGSDIVAVIKELLMGIYKLLVFLKPFIDGIFILGPIFELVMYLVKTLESIFGI